MAYIPRLDDEDKQQNGNTNQILSDAPAGDNPSTGGGGSAGAGGAKAGAPAQDQGFAGLMDYMNSNQEQAGGLADQVAGNLNDEYTKAKSTIDTNLDSADKAAKDSTINYDDNFTQDAVKNPASFVQDPNNVAKFKGYRDATYKGPGSVEDTDFYGNASKAGTRANDIYESTKNNGYSGLLTQLESNPTSGKTALDLGLLNSNPDSMSKIQGALQPFSGVSDYLKGRAANVNADIGAARQSATDASTKTRSAVQGANDTLVNGINDRATQRQQTVQTQGQAAKDLFSNLGSADISKVSDDLLNYVGMTRDQLADFQNRARVTQQGFRAGMSDDPYSVNGESPDLSPYVKAPIQVGPESVASKDEYARSAALAQLMGDEYTPYLNPGMSDMADSAMGPEFDMSGADSYLNPLVSKVQAAQKGFQDANKPTTDAINAAIEAEKARNRAAGTTGPVFRAM